jgi:hypothetical protein
MRNFWIVMRMPTFGNEEVEDSIRRGRTDNPFGMTRDSIPKEFYISEEAANRACSRLAGENPLKPYTVMKISTILETGTPTVVTKKFNESGELVIV